MEQTGPAKRLTRDPAQGMVAGVAAGIADYAGVDPVLVRLGFVLAALLNGLGLIVYLACWVLIPRRDRPEPAPPGEAPADRLAEEVREAGERVREAGAQVAEKVRLETADAPGGGGAVVGLILIVVGVVFLLDRWDLFDWWDWAVIGRLWPVVLILMGIAIVIDAARRRSG